MLPHLAAYYRDCIKNCRDAADSIVNSVPIEWNIPEDIIRKKVEELSKEDWTSAVWSNFVECLNENSENE